MAVPKAGTGRERVFRTKGFVILHPAAGTSKNAREKRERVGTEWMRKKAVSRETGGFVNSAVKCKLKPPKNHEKLDLFSAKGS